LWDFLLKILRIQQFGLFSEPFIYEVLYPYCQGELLILLSNALTTGESFDSLHARLLQHFITTRQLSQLRTENYENVHDEGESLANYIQTIKDATLVLRITETETEVVSRILEGLTPTQRARFVFQAPPNNFKKLEQLAVVDRNIPYSDETPTHLVAAARVNAVPRLRRQGSYPFHGVKANSKVKTSYISIVGKLVIAQRLFFLQGAMQKESNYLWDANMTRQREENKSGVGEWFTTPRRSSSSKVTDSCSTRFRFCTIADLSSLSAVKSGGRRI
jgi:hypothetical protein